MALVTSHYDWSEIDERYREAGIFPVIPEAGLRATVSPARFSRSTRPAARTPTGGETPYISEV